jgi:hypothetical protein
LREIADSSDNAAARREAEALLRVAALSTIPVAAAGSGISAANLSRLANEVINRGADWLLTRRRLA